MARSLFAPVARDSADPGEALPGSFLPRIGCRPPGRQPPDGSSLTRLLRVRGPNLTDHRDLTMIVYNQLIKGETSIRLVSAVS